MRQKIMKTGSLIKYLAAGLFMFQFKTAFGADSGAKFTGSTGTSRAVYQKVFTDLKSSKITKKDLEKLGPGVTGGGDSCEQKIAYSYAFLLEMIENDKISAEVFKADKEPLLAHLKQTKFSFDRGLEKGRPVEMLNAPVINAILVDRELCNNNFEPLSYYAPLLMHEALRLAGRQEDDANFEISKSYVGKIRQEADRQLNSNRRSFRVMSGTANGTIAMAWGLRGEPLDFENYDKLSYGEQLDFIEQNKFRLENYLVDLKRMRILKVIKGLPEGANEDNYTTMDMAFAEFGDTHLSYNHIDLQFHFDPKTNVGFTVAEMKWQQSMEVIFALNEKQELVGSCDWDCQKVIEQAAEQKLTAAQKREIAKYSLVNYYYALKQSGDKSYWEVEIGAIIPKTDEGVIFKAPMALKFEKGNFKATIGNFKKQK